ncbi:MAG: CorA family divalent cation transporter [Alkalispirochaeta sp.]
MEWRGEYTPPGEAATAREGVSQATVYDFGPSGVSREETLGVEELRRLPPLAESDTASVRLVVVAGRPVGRAHAAAADMVPLSALEREDLFSVGHQVKVAAVEASVGERDPGVLVLLPFAIAIDGEIVHSRIALVQFARTVVLFYDVETPVVQVLLDRIRRGTGRVRHMPANYVAYLVIDAVVDTHSGVSAFLLEQLEDLEEQILDGRNDQTLFRWTQDIRIVSVWVRRLMSHLEREITAAVHSEAGVFAESVLPFAVDVHEHTRMIQDSLETRREQAASLIPLYTAISGAAMNEIMKTLTIIATIFIPLTFVAGIYGMNFERMPELTWQWGYPVVLTIMAVVAGGMIWWFRRRKWIGRDRRGTR